MFWRHHLLLLLLWSKGRAANRSRSWTATWPAGSSRRRRRWRRATDAESTEWNAEPPFRPDWRCCSKAPPDCDTVQADRQYIVDLQFRKRIHLVVVERVIAIQSSNNNNYKNCGLVASVVLPCPAQKRLHTRGTCPRSGKN